MFLKTFMMPNMRSYKNIPRSKILNDRLVLQTITKDMPLYKEVQRI